MEERVLLPLASPPYSLPSSRGNAGACSTAHALTLWYISTAPSRCAATSAVPSAPGSQASETQREALAEPSGFSDSEVTGRLLDAAARSCARSESSTTARERQRRW